MLVKILFWQWDAFMQKGMENALKDLGIDFDRYYYPLSDWESDDIFVINIQQKLSKGKYNMVLSVNYCPMISNVCQALGIQYISWVYDAPVHIRDIRSFHNSCNKIYFFDRGQALTYQREGYPNIYHLPLAADTNVWQFVEDEKYNCDLAFVGRLYRSDYEYLIRPLSQYYRGMLEGFVSAQGQVYGAYFLDEMITESFMDEVNPFYLKASGGEKSVESKEMEFACVCELARRERIMALSLLAKRCNVHLYSGDANPQIEGIIPCGFVSYYSEMPSAFRGAKINLNISLRAIRTGIPLRVLDVMSCGGFLITNYQEELLDYFEPGVDLVIYEDIKDLVLKVSYYLKHEEERKRIAQSGYKKVKKYFGFESRIKDLLQMWT